MKQLITLALCLLILAPEFVRSEILASSGSPMAEANPSRNHQINKKLLCPDVAPGKTQVWNVAWKTQLPANFRADFSVFGDLTQDEQGFIYLHCRVNGDTNSKILKFNGTDGLYDISLMYSAPFATSTAVPTHVKGNKMYIAAAEMTTVVNTTSMTDIAVIPHASYDASSYVLGTYAPLNKDFMVTANPASSAVNILRYLNTSSAQFDTNQPNVVSAYANNVIIYTTASGVNIPIVVLGTTYYTGGTITVWSPNYQITIPGTNLAYDDSYVQNNQLVVQYYTYSPYTFNTAIFNPETGTSIQNITRGTFNGTSPAYIYNLKLFGTKSIAYGSIDYTSKVIDFVNEKVIIEGREVSFRPLYSIPDNSVLIATKSISPTPVIEFISLDWDTDAINAVGSFPLDAYFLDITVSPPIIGEDCMLYQYFDGYSPYPTTMFAFKPLPVSDIVPILECVNDDGLGYFTYHSLADINIVIPYVSDRNNLEPMDIAPSNDFKAHRRGKYFPLSSRVTLDNSNSSFTWKLEDYVLSFNNTEQLRCPTDVKFIMFFNATNAVPSGFDEWTRKAFVTITGISDSRVTVVVNKKRGSVPSDLEVELQVATGNSSQEMTPEQTVQKFAEQQLYTFNSQLASDPTYSPSNITLVDIDGTGPLATEISGTKQTPPLTQAPIGQPISQPPSQPPTDNNTPKATVVSSGSSLLLSSGALIMLVLAYCVSYSIHR